jgi:hypothetical protein
LSDVTVFPRLAIVALHALSADTVTFAGATMLGFVLSVTVTVCVAVAVFPDPSVTVHVTVVTPNGKVAGASFVTLATVQLSDVVAAPKLTLNALHVPFAFTATFAGAVIVGFVLSFTVTV